MCVHSDVIKGPQGCQCVLSYPCQLVHEQMKCNSLQNIFTKCTKNMDETESNASNPNPAPSTNLPTQEERTKPCKVVDGKGNQFLKPKFQNLTKISLGEDTYTIGRQLTLFRSIICSIVRNGMCKEYNLTYQVIYFSFKNWNFFRRQIMRFIEISADITDIRGYYRYQEILHISGDITYIWRYHRYQVISQLSGDITYIRGYHRYQGISQILEDIKDITGYHRQQGILQISGDITDIREYYRYQEISQISGDITDIR